MRQKKIILDNLTPENSASKLPVYLTFYRNAIDRKDHKGDTLMYKDGSIPFFLETRKVNTITPDDFKELESRSISLGMKISKKSLLETYYVYRIPDFGHQSLSPGFDDFSYQCYDNQGYKLSETLIAVIRNYTSKEGFLLIKKDRLKDLNHEIHVIIDFKKADRNKLGSSNALKLIRNENGKFVFNMSHKSDSGRLDTRIDTLDTIEFFVKEGTTEYRLNNSEYMFNIEGVNFASDNGSEFVSEQGTYFNYIQRNSGV